jgi:hypothetical protein
MIIHNCGFISYNVPCCYSSTRTRYYARSSGYSYSFFKFFSRIYFCFIHQYYYINLLLYNYVIALFLRRKALMSYLLYIFTSPFLGPVNIIPLAGKPLKYTSNILPMAPCATIRIFLFLLFFNVSFKNSSTLL